MRSTNVAALTGSFALAVALAFAPKAAVAQEGEEPSKPAPVIEGVLPEPHFMTRAIDFATRTAGDGSGERSGFYPEFGSMITGAGWISVGGGYRRWIDGDRMVFDASAAISWRSYKMAHANFEFTNLLRSRVALGTEVRWQDYTQNSYFGAGAETAETGRSEYRLRSLNAVGYARLRPRQWLTIGANGGWLQRPDIERPAGTFRRDYPAVRDLFPAEPVFALAEQPSYVHGELSLTADTRDHRSHPLRGGLYRGAWTRYWARDLAAFSFQRFEAEGAQFVPMASSRVTLALRGWVVASDPAAGASVPFYLMPSLGGNNTLRAYANYRFHDRHLAVVNIETRLALMTHVDLAVFADAGNVAARLADLNFDRTSFGVGLRLHTERATFGRVDVAHGREGWRVMFNTSDPLHLSRLSRRTAAVPFVP
jgi:hypothetical protein